MIQSALQLRRTYRPASQLAVAGGVGVLLGAVSVWGSPVLAIAVVIGAALAFASLKRPEIAVLAILVATSSILFENRLPLVPLPAGLGSLHIPDFVLLGLIALTIVRWLVEPNFKFIRTPLDVPLLAFYSVILLSIFLAVVQSSLEFHIARRSVRLVTYYLTFFIVTNLIREDRQLRLLLRGFLVLAIIVAVAMILQFLVGVSLPFLPERVETLVTQGTAYGGITRVLPPGQLIIQVAFIALTVTSALSRFRTTDVSRFVQWGILGVAIVLTFMRSFWVGVSIAMLILLLIVKGHDRRRLVAWGSVALLLSALVFLLALGRPDSQIARLSVATIDRLATLGKEQTVQEDSLQWRYVEIEYALNQIASHPLLGIGLGATYRAPDPRIDTSEGVARWEQRGLGSYIHNGHLEILMMSGALGYFFFAWVSLTFLVRGFKHWRLIHDPEMRGYVLGFVLSYIAVLISALLHPWFTVWYWTGLWGIMMGINEVAIRRGLIERDQDAPEYRQKGSSESKVASSLEYYAH